MTGAAARRLHEGPDATRETHDRVVAVTRAGPGVGRALAVITEGSAELCLAAPAR